MKRVFILLGIGETIVSRCLMTSMDYYRIRFNNDDLAFQTSVMMYSSTLIFGTLLLIFQNKISLPIQLFGSLVGLIATYAGCPLVAFLFPNQIGMYIYYLMIFFNGSFKIMGYQSSIGYSQLFPKDNFNIYFLTGTGISGILAFVLRAIALASLEDLNQSLILYLIFTVCLQIWVCISFYQFYYSSYSQQHLSQLSIQPIIETTDQDNNNKYNDILLIVRNSSLNLLGIVLGFFVSYGLFPGMVQKKQYEVIGMSWNTTLLAGNFELFDTIGKYLSIYSIFNKYVINIIVLARVSFIFVFIGIVHAKKGIWNEYWMIHFMLILCAFSNGYCDSTNIKQVTNGLKQPSLLKQAGYVSIFCIFVGTFSGSMFGLYLKTL